MIARLRSPHTVDLFDFGVRPTAPSTTSWSCSTGSTRDSLLQRFGPQPAERAIYLLRQVCHSLSEAESCGLVHRDIKPANIFLCRYGEEYDFVKVLDFGIVKRAREEPARDPTETQENAVQGTPAFIAPEQAMGLALDGRADIYATGCVAYWLLTGQYVFTADTPMGLLMQHVRTAPTPPSTRTGTADSARARPSGPVVSGQGPGGAAAVGPGAVAAPGRYRRRDCVDAGAGPRVVGGAPARVRR